MPVHTYTNWNSRPSDQEEQVEPFRKYYFICEGANTETFYFEKLIDLRKELGIHPLIDIRLWEKTEGDKNISFAKNLAAFAKEQKSLEENEFDSDRDKMIIVFDGDIFEEKVQGYDGSFEKYIQGHEVDFLTMVDGKYAYAYNALLDATGMNAKKNANIGNLAENVMIAIRQEKLINQDIHQLKGKVSSNIGLIIEGIINEEPDI